MGKQLGRDLGRAGINNHKWMTPIGERGTQRIFQGKQKRPCRDTQGRMGRRSMEKPVVNSLSWSGDQRSYSINSKCREYNQHSDCTQHLYNIYFT